MQARILLIGKRGQVGWELQRALLPLGTVYAPDRSECDLANTQSIRAVVDKVKPQFIVNAAAYTAVDAAEHDADRAFIVNAIAPGLLAQEAGRHGALVIHYSTDYVFDGHAAGFHNEQSVTSPKSVYGSSKLAGEVAIRESGAAYVIFRTSWVFGFWGNNFLKTILRLATERDELRVVVDQIGAPTSAALIADVTAHTIRELVNGRKSFSSGIFHLAAAGETSWYEYAQYILEAARAAGRPLRLHPQALIPISSVEYPTPAVRPLNSRLDTSKLRTSFGVHLPHWTIPINHVMQQVCDR
ncbi:dTDP-4-dehydrorhamnose reductase [Rhizobium sp. CECT 9324]|uniref:dTDP-4-dehydrorhamnose reductase n=1 Tax=Rhizobium sp. CECT 9324 TaxID=2845820 RepID=UPI001E3FAD57|nr:dTDP-4-dehydrorhamnose reductase [Rhizobium sp. CECT 9324]CAH0343180.1 dTDP-4-dehydrorhamnose reductase [Rhizobium sp. CECT 9324]